MEVDLFRRQGAPVNSAAPPAPGDAVQEAPAPGDAVQGAPAPGDAVHKALARALADELGETDPKVRQLLKRLVKRLGWSMCEQARDDTREIEASGGLWSVSQKKRRSKGGTFFALLKMRSVKARYLVFEFHRTDKSAEPPFTWEQRGELVRETSLHPGQAMTAKLTLMGRPEKVVQRQDFVVTSLEYRGAPSLPKGLPLPKSTRTMYTVYIAAKQWRKVADFIQRPEDQLIVEGFCLPDPESGGIALFAQSVSTQLLQRQKLAGAQEPAALQAAAASKPELSAVTPHAPATARAAAVSKRELTAPTRRAPAVPGAAAPATPAPAAQPPSEEEQIRALLRQGAAGGRTLEALAAGAGLPLQRLRDIHEGRSTSLTPAQVRTLLQKLRQALR